MALRRIVGRYARWENHRLSGSPVGSTHMLTGGCRIRGVQALSSMQTHGGQETCGRFRCGVSAAALFHAIPHRSFRCGVPAAALFH